MTALANKPGFLRQLPDGNDNEGMEYEADFTFGGDFGHVCDATGGEWTDTIGLERVSGRLDHRLFQLRTHEECT